MIKPYLKLFIFLLLMGNSLYSLGQDSIADFNQQEVRTLLDKHLTHFFPDVIDLINGGYYANFERDWTRSKEQNKMMVTQARTLWMAAKAAQFFPENKIYPKSAKHGFRFLTHNMRDFKHGGFKTNWPADSNGINSNIQLCYAHSFVLFALAEYAKIDSSQTVLGQLEEAFNWMESNAHDSIYGGYFNLIMSTETAQQILHDQQAQMRLGWGSPLWKDQNTSIHILEALSNVYRLMPTEQVHNRLSEMLALVRDTMVQKDSTLKLYFTRNWQPISYADSTRDFILKNQGIDHISFGHNIETAYLLIDASIALNGHADTLTLKVAKNLTDHCLQNGFDINFQGLFDRGYEFDGQIEIIDSSKSWWAQFEAWHTLALMQQYYPEEKSYQHAFIQMWNYMNKNLIDPVYGGHYNYGIDTYPENIEQKKVHHWKGPYHDGRALINVWQYLTQGMLKIEP